jgi:uncharacterized protein (TIGR03790 family)
VAQCAWRTGVAGAPLLLQRPPGIGPNELAVVVNANDALSVSIAKYYQEHRRIPEQNVVRIRFTPGATVMPKVEFDRVYRELNANIPIGVQALMLTWLKPWRVDCMSITTAFAAGFDSAYCASSCTPTKPSPYFNSNSDRPYDDFGLRPTMSLAASDLDSAKRLIDRGLGTDDSFPEAKAYLLETSDEHRSVRKHLYDDITQKLSRLIPIERIKADFIADKTDVLFYFTGLIDVPKIETNKFVPGAIADHLTSTGGILESGKQMSSLKWLQAGATGSYGTVIEPCNILGKFPHPGIVMARYLSGETLLEAYWKSVEMPGQGLFIGEPLASPFGARRTPAPQ